MFFYIMAFFAVIIFIILFILPVQIKVLCRKEGADLDFKFSLYLPGSFRLFELRIFDFKYEKRAGLKKMLYYKGLWKYPIIGIRQTEETINLINLFKIIPQAAGIILSLLLLSDEPRLCRYLHNKFISRPLRNVSKLFHPEQLCIMIVMLINVFKKSRGFICHKFFWSSEMGAKDAALTGSLAGVIWQLKGVSVLFLNQYLSFQNKPEIIVNPAYNKQCFDFKLDSIFNLRMGYIIISVLLFVFRIFTVKWR